jgi:protein-S-isoprenylcysteine O-methyltransferase Ste14
MKKIARKLLSFSMGSAVFSGLPFVGWGLGDPQGFLQNSARAGYVLMMLVLMILVVLFVPEEGRGSGVGKKLVNRQKWAVTLLQILSLAIVIYGPYCDRRELAVMGDGMAVRWVGLGTVFFGFALMNWAVITLKNQFSVDVTIQENHQLITTGPYSYIRHPRYLGLILFLSGTSLVFRSWMALIFAVASVLVLIWRIRDEENLMRQEFTDTWEEYTKRSWRLIPYVY